MRGVATLVLSLGAHAAMVGAAADRRGGERPAMARSAGLAERARAAAAPVLIAADRRELVERARADRKAGTLRVGAFLLEAGAIDAREEGRVFDLEKARSLWEARLERLAGAADLAKAIPAVFGDLHYYGRTGRSMGDALIEGGGACEPIAHLVAAAIHDTGHPDRALLRFYGGGNDSGDTHLTAVLREGDRERDLLSGRPAQRTGALLDAADLVEVYARAHGLAPSRKEAARADQAEKRGSGGSAPDAPLRVTTLAGGYPPNADRYPGSTPVYATRAVQEPGVAAGGTLKAPVAVPPTDCAYFVRMAALDPPRVLIDGVPRDEGAFAGFAVELRRVPSSAQLDRAFEVVDNVERDLEKSARSPTADRLVELACLSAFYGEAATDFALASQHDLSRLASARKKRAVEEGEKLLAGVDWSAPAGKELLARLVAQHGGRAWVLLFLPGGDAPVRALAAAPAGDRDVGGDFGRVAALAALLVSPATREIAEPLFASLPRRAQIDVMHEVFRAHDHLRPWASSYPLETAGDSELGRAYRVFRMLAWGLWEGARPQDEVLASLLRGTAEARLDRAWMLGFLEYYGKNALALHFYRADGQAMARAFREWLLAHGYTDAEVYRQAVAAAREPT
jgi:hypothetical protein